MYKLASMHETIERYQKYTKDSQANNPPSEHNMQQLKHEAASMIKKIELLETSKRKLLGEGLGPCTIEELQQLEQQLERSVTTIRARKMQVYKQQIEHLKEKEKALAAENAMLCEKGLQFGLQTRGGGGGSNEERAVVPSAEISEVSDVETELFIGLPETRHKRPYQK
ncbi:MADS-box protein soc1, variant 3 [Salvia divinorum]|uniref:MADS-box protein soc1, variant 3 n=1 Tax=Salvia divinorum TaxID=28513 RepID=A0ABD1GH72_SALDI